jgi:hypothetical protein
MILERAEEARESREKTRMTATYEKCMTHPGGECLFLSNFLILFALIGVIRGQFPDLGLSSQLFSTGSGALSLEAGPPAGKSDHPQTEKCRANTQINATHLFHVC